MAALIVNSAGLPEPSTDIIRRLKQVHPRLGLRFSQAQHLVWQITMDWAENDERHARVQRGELGAGSAFDIIGYLPLDCSVSEAPAFLARFLRESPVDEIKSLSGGLQRYNAEVAAKEAERALNDMFESGNPSEKESRRVTGRRKKVELSKE